MVNVIAGFQLDGHWSAPDVKYNLSSAHLRHYSVCDHIPGQAPLQEQDGMTLISFETLHEVRAEEVIARMYREETGILIEEKAVMLCQQATRFTVAAVANSIASQTGRPRVAFPLPNWHFWTIDQALHRRFRYFEGSDEDRLVSAFEKTAKAGDISSLILAYPSTPLMYTPSADALKRIDAIACSAGIRIIVDDVVRGTRLPGDRKTIAEHLSDPVVVESFAKRFGDIPFHVASYIIAPRGELPQVVATSLSDKLDMTRAEFSVAIGDFMERALKHASSSAQQEMLARNTAFDDGMRQYCPEVMISRPSSTYLTALLELPPGYPLSAQRCAHELRKNGFKLYPITDFYPSHLEQHTKRKNVLRITTGQLRCDQLRDAGVGLGMGIRQIGVQYQIRTD